jgi:putative ABC transport system ATP-binding protein
METKVSLRNVTKRYRSGHWFTSVLDDLDLDVQPGEFLAIMGPSGSGKTTLLNIIGGLDHPDSGSVIVAGTCLDNLEQNALTRWRARHVGFVFQSHYLLPMLSAQDNVALPLLLTRLSRTQRHQRATEALDRVGLMDRAHHMPSQLSGGQQQRVGIARAIVTGPAVLLCDEPTTGLDRAAADSILELLAELSRNGHTVVMVTHDAHAAGYANRCIELATAA